ncbi:MAG: hypothetical protein KGS45_03260 [Planctomycetes bacterium]|nr:hypothetical protein [Planctomycetota bacterium]
MNLPAAINVVQSAIAHITPPWAVRDPEPLPGPGLVDRWVLESPGSLVLGGVILVIALIIAGRRAVWGNRALVVGGVIAVLGAAVIAASLLVQTDREVIQSRSEEITIAVVNANRSEMERLMGANLQVTYFGAPQGLNKQETIERVTTLHTNGILREVKASVAEVQASADNQRFGRSQIKVSASGDITGGYPTLSWWKLEWEKVDGAWKVIAVEPISIPGMSNPAGKAAR